VRKSDTFARLATSAASLTMTAPTAAQNSSPTSYRAQNGEDRWLEAYFGGRRQGFYVDVGAYDGVDLSNSYHFEQIGWSGVLVEPDPDRAAHCIAHRPRSHTFHCAAVASPNTTEIVFHRAESGVFSTTHLTDDHAKRVAGMGLALAEMRVPAKTLDSILEEVGAGKVDFVSIDVEGGEMDVLSGFDIRRWAPEIVVVESNTRTRLDAIRAYFVGHGYVYCHSIDVNDFYRRADGAPWSVWLADHLNYLRHRINWRLARTANNLRRSWRKRFDKDQRTRPS
jgi:FkbM family methyltransferase